MSVQSDVAPGVLGQPPRPAAPRAAAGRKRKRRVDNYIVLAVIWMAFEWMRPPTPFKIPMLISLALLAGWLMAPRKVFRPQVVLSLAFIGLSLFGIPFAYNYFSAYQVSRVLGIIIVCLAVPMMQFIDRIYKLHWVIWSMVLIFTYMAVWALGHGGNGPGGGYAGMDENYTALFMSASLPMAFFMLFTTKSMPVRMFLIVACICMVGATVIGFSRGGFLGLVGVAFYCWLRSPQKLAALVLGLLGGLGMLALAPESFWAEMSTIGDTSEGTADMRFELWKIAFWQFLDNPLIGVGAGNFPWETFQYETFEQTQKINRTMGGNVTHSFYFELISEHGLAGIIIIGLLCYYNAMDLRYVGRRARAGYRRARGQRGRVSSDTLRELELAPHQARMLAGAMIGFFICSAFVSTLYYSAFWLWTALVVALRRGTDYALADLSAQLAAAPDAGPDDAPAPRRRKTRPDPPEADRSASLSQLWRQRGGRRT